MQLSFLIPKKEAKISGRFKFSNKLNEEIPTFNTLLEVKKEDFEKTKIWINFFSGKKQFGDLNANLAELANRDKSLLCLRQEKKNFVFSDIDQNYLFLLYFDNEDASTGSFEAHIM